MKSYLRSKVLQLLWGRDEGLCGGKLLGPSMLRDMIELRRDDWLSLALKVEVVRFDDTPLLMVHKEFGWLEPGVLDVDRWFFGDEGADPTVLRDYEIESLKQISTRISCVTYFSINICSKQAFHEWPRKRLVHSAVMTWRRRVRYRRTTLKWWW